ncbi:MAG: ATP synthase F1 subunit epsilon [Magnetospiraceae bacterium]
MADMVAFELVSPTALVLSEEVEMVVVPGGDGDFGVLPGHTPLLSTVRPGVIDIHEGGKVARSLFVDGGFAEVTPERVVVLSEEVIPVADLSADTAEARLQEATQELSTADDEVHKRIAERKVAIAEAMKAALERR